jgi:hypothetical protein
MPDSNLKRSRLTAVRRAMIRLNKNRYQIMRLIGAGELEAETVDEHLAIRTASLDRYEAENPKAA